MFNITSKYFSIFNNKPPASWVAHVTSDFLTCYSCLYYNSMICLNITSDMVVLYENDALSILVLSTKKRYSSFLKKGFIFEKIDFKVKLLTTLKISTDCHIKTCWSLKRRGIFKIPITISQKYLCSFY